MIIKKNLLLLIIFSTIIITTAFITISSSSPTLTIQDVYDKGTGFPEPEKIAEQIYKADNNKKYSKSDIEQAKDLDKKGYALYKAKKDKEAVEYYLQSLKIYPMAQTYYNLGNSLMNVNKYDTAEVAYLVALQYRPGNYLYNYNLACAYSLKNNVILSLMYLEKALKLGYNAYAYIWKDPDMKNTRKNSTFDKIMKFYSSKKLTDSDVIKEGYCEVDHGYYLERFIFGSNKTLMIKSEGRGPYSGFYESYNKNGSWFLNNGQVQYKTTDSNITSTLYLKLGKHECSY